MAVCQLRPYETLNIFKPEDRAAGSFEQILLIQGNAILSTIVIESLDSGSVLVEFEEIIYEDQVKPLFSKSFSAPGTYQFWTHPFHTKIKVTVTTTDTSTFTIKSTVRTDVEILRSSSLDGADFDPTDNKHIPVGCYDPDQEKLFFLRCKNGVLVTDPIDTGDPIFIDGETATTPGVIQTLFTSIVPVGKTHILSKIHISGSIGGKWLADIDSTIIGSGRIASGSPDSTLEFTPRRKILAGESFRVRFTSKSKPIAGSDVNHHVMLAEI